MIDRSLVLEGDRVRLEPLRAEHLPELRARCGDEALWELVYASNPFLDDASAQQWFDEALNCANQLTFVIIDRPTGNVIGSTRFMDVVPKDRKLEIGWTFIAKPFWRTHVNRECKLLMLAYAFEKWNAVRVQLKAEARNARSRDAMAAWGATYEGTMRNFRIRPKDGTIRDVAYYSVIPDEWPAVRARLRRLLAARTEAPISA